MGEKCRACGRGRIGEEDVIGAGGEEFRCPSRLAR